MGCMTAYRIDDYDDDGDHSHRRERNKFEHIEIE